LEVAVTERRRNIEGRWVNFMIARGCLELHVRGTVIAVIAYSHVPGSRFTRTADLLEWLPGIFNPESKMRPRTPVQSEDVVLNGEMAAIEIWPQKDESHRHHFFLPTILWAD
jgi:hypothetical protein